MQHGLDGGDDTAPASASTPSSLNGHPTSPPIGEVSLLVQHWQATADPASFEQLLHVIEPAVQHVARRILFRHGVRDPGAVDDAVSLVFDHLRRLAPADGTERRVARFEADRASTTGCGDAGAAYVVWLARERALDVVRRQRRQDRRCQWLEEHGPEHVPSSPSAAAEDSELADLLHDAVARLPERERVVCELLLTGESQTMIAGLLGVCEGTVSRIRQRVIAALREDLPPQ